jgi:hypothetical protein
MRSVDAHDLWWLAQPGAFEARPWHIIFPILAAAMAVFDLRWRWREEPDPRWVVKALSADAGGALALLPAWLLWIALSVIGIFVLITVPDEPSPYSSPPAHRMQPSTTRDNAAGAGKTLASYGRVIGHDVGETPIAQAMHAQPSHT